MSEDLVYFTAEHGHSVCGPGECQMCHREIPASKDHPSILEIQNKKVRRSFSFCDKTCLRLYERNHTKKGTFCIPDGKEPPCPTK